MYSIVITLFVENTTKSFIIYWEIINILALPTDELDRGEEHMMKLCLWNGSI